MRAAIDAGELAPERLASLEHLVAEEAALEAEQERFLRRGEDFQALPVEVRDLADELV